MDRIREICEANAAMIDNCEAPADPADPSCGTQLECYAQNAIDTIQAEGLVFDGSIFDAIECLVKGR